MKHIKLIDIILYVDDQQASADFYTKIFRRSPDLSVPGMTEFILTEKCKLGLMPNQGIARILRDKTPHPGKGNGIPRCELYFYVENIQLEFDNAIESGATLICPIEDRDWGDRACYFSDPDGHIIAFAERIKRQNEPIQLFRHIGNIRVRKAVAGDLPDVYRLICELENDTLEYESFKHIFEKNLENQDCFYIVAETENRVAGFISLHIQQLLHHSGAVGEVQEFYMDKDCRGKGIGRLLMSEVKKYAEAHRVKSLEVTSNKKRTENVKVYESLGFRLTHNKFTI